MCPPVSTRYAGEGLSHLYASWLYQLQHGDQLRTCFACFKAAFLDLKDALELEDWDEDAWDAEPMDLTEAEPEQEGAPGAGPSWGQGQGQPGQGSSAGWVAEALASAPAASEAVSLNHHFVPTELDPQDAVSLCLGPEDSDWTQVLPWRFEDIPSCSHWPSLPPPWQGVLNVDLPPGEPMLLELGTIWPMDSARLEAWLLDLQVVSLVGRYDAVYLRKMTAGWVLRAPGLRWKLLLEPDEVWVVRLQDAPEEQELHQWKLSILETSAGSNAELVPAHKALLMRGLTIVSYAPWARREAERQNSLPSFEFATPFQAPCAIGTWSSVPRSSGESMPDMGAAALGEVPCFLPFSPKP
ncbi:testis-expressed protein 19 [Lepus europaeus]|uniref:testis-expressed protein 19 n=1 Tax=Lepus europaeus TaxID=9983 RepID=UPI002B488C64|nr:testis-expressed protein 19 [Lepus europaeus]